MSKTRETRQASSPAKGKRSSRAASRAAPGATPHPEAARARFRPPPKPRVLTREVCLAFADMLLSDDSHNVSSAATAVGLRPKTVLSAIERYADGATPTSEEDEEAMRILAAAKEEHVRRLRARGDDSAVTSNMPGVSHWRWRCEVQDPRNHPRPSQKLEHTGADGGPIEVRGRDPSTMSLAEIQAEAARLVAEIQGEHQSQLASSERDEMDQE